MNTAMAPVLSKDAADIEVPTARGVSWGGRGAQRAGAGEGAGVARERGGDAGNFAFAGGLGGRVDGQGARALRGQRGREVEGSRDWRGYRLGWDLGLLWRGLRKPVVSCPEWHDLEAQEFSEAESGG